MKIAFVLPTSGRLPSGGHRVVYEYANRLARRGHTVEIAHFSNPQTARQSPGAEARSIVRYIRDRYERGFAPAGWFQLDPAVRCTFHYNARRAQVRDPDVLVATAWETADFVSRHPAPACGRVYFIQSYETWSGAEADVVATWRYPMTRVVISRWLEDIATGMGLDAQYVPNGVDMALFRLTRPIEERPPNSILFQSMTRELKGSRDTVAALNRLRARGLDLRLTSFGQVHPRELGLEGAVEHHPHPEQPMLARLYNDAAIYVTASHLEGWGMTMTEAAACGAAIAVSDIGGHRSFAEPDRNAVVFPPRDPERLADAVAGLVTDPARRIALAHQAHQDVQQLSWEMSGERFAQIVETAERRGPRL